MSKPKGDDQTPPDDRDFPPFADASGFPADDAVPGGDGEPLFFEESGGGSAEPTDDDIARMLQEMSGGEADGGYAGGAERDGAAADCLYRAHGARGVVAAADAGGGAGVVPGFGVAAGAVVAASGVRGAVCVGLSDSAGGGC